MNPRHPNQLDPSKATLIVVDLQEGFAATIHEWDKIVARTAIVVQTAKSLEVPILAVEQYPQRLGSTVAAIRSALPETVAPIAKTAFSACGAVGFMDLLAASGRKQVMLCGIETHVCMNQSAHDLLAAGYQVHLLHDCTSSRHPADREAGLAKMRTSGAIPCTSEMAVFELMRDAKHEKFKTIHPLIK